MNRLRSWSSPILNRQKGCVCGRVWRLIQYRLAWLFYRAWVVSMAASASAMGRAIVLNPEMTVTARSSVLVPPLPGSSLTPSGTTLVRRSRSSVTIDVYNWRAVLGRTPRRRLSAMTSFGHPAGMHIVPKLLVEHHPQNLDMG